MGHDILMQRTLITQLILASLLFGQSSYDILSVPTDARDAALGINLNPTIRPTELLTHDGRQVTLSGWSWIADIQSMYLGIELPTSYLSIRSVDFGELEYRGETPSEKPISTFGYSLYTLSGAHAFEINTFQIGIAAEFLYERTLNNSATGISVNLAAAFPIREDLKISMGWRHLGGVGELKKESTTLPTELWLAADLNLARLQIFTETNTGAYPFALGAAYNIAHIFNLMSGLQVEPSNSNIRVHPSIGFSLAWGNFTLGYTNYQLSHVLGSRHFLSLYWSY
jgi:hypothetical protein